jgi:multidrug resistance efflux pump
MFTKFLNEITKFLKADSTTIRQIIVFAVAIGFLELTVPFAVQVIINRLYTLYAWEPLVSIILIVVFLLVIHASYLFIRFQALEFVQRKLVVRITNSIVTTVVENPAYQKADYLLRYFETVTLKKNIAKMLTGGIGFGLSLIFGLSILMVYHIYFGLLALFIVISHLFLIYYYHDRSSETAIYESKKKYEIAKALVNHVKELDQKRCIELLDEYLDKRHKHYKHLRTQYFFSLIIFIISHIIILAGGGHLVLQGELTIGQLVASELIFSVILASLAKSIDYIEVYYAMVASFDKLNFIENPQELTVTHFDRFKNSYARWYKLTAAIFVILPIVLLATPWIQTSQGRGVLTTLRPEERVQEISALVDGRISRWLVQEGEFVKRDQPLVEIADNDPNYAERLKADRDAALKKYEVEKLSAETAYRDFQRQKQLFDEGLTSRVKYEKAQIEYQKLLAKEAEAASSLAKSEINYSRQQRQVVVAPADGYIQQLLSGNSSSSIKKGAKLAIFVPETTTPAVEIFVSGNDVPLIQSGRKARLEFEGFPAFQFSGWPDIGFGTFEGQVVSVDSVASKGGKFRVLISPLKNEAWPSDKILRRGAKVLGWVQMNKVTVGYELWRQFNGFPPVPDDVAIESYKKSSEK